MKLHTKPASFRAQKILIAAQYSGAKVDVVTTTAEKALKQMTPVAKFPLLETKDGAVVESNAIARYIAQGSSKLLGASAFEKASVDSWMEFSANDIEIPATVVCYPIIGWMEYHSQAFEKGKKDLNVSFQSLEAHLKTRTFLVGESVTIADIAVATALLLPFKLVVDPKLRKTFPCVTRWFTTCVNQTEFLKVVGETVLCEKAMTPKGYKAPAAEPAKKEKKKPEPKPAPVEVEPPLDDPVSEKKAKHYCDELPKSSLVLDSWKRQYSNAPGGDCYKAMPWFWENLDKSGYCLYRGDYKYNDELEVAFMVSNLAGGFVQRCDEIRKYAFGTIQILEKDGKMKLTGCWLFRGDSNKLMIDANPDAESYEWTKLDPEKDKKIVEDLWCAGEEIEGWPIADCKVFK